jgi:hypothetical protein
MNETLTELAAPLRKSQGDLDGLDGLGGPTGARRTLPLAAPALALPGGATVGGAGAHARLRAALVSAAWQDPA